MNGADNIFPNSRSATPSKSIAERSAGGKADNGGIDYASIVKKEIPKESKPEWRMVKDAKSGRNYWYNRQTRETTWFDPYKNSAMSSS